MADKSVSELIAARSVTPTDLFVLEQNGTAKKLTGQILENWLVSFADGHGGIQNIEKVSTDVLVDTYRITLSDTTTFDFVVNNGRGIVSIERTKTSGLVDTYTITYNDNTTGTFTVTNGEKGDKGDNTYVWIKYASQKPTSSSHSFGDVPDSWMGIYFGNLSEAPEDWSEYDWYNIKGAKGDTGDPATLISATVTYQVGDTGNIIPSGAWTESIPMVAQGKYLWTKIVQQFNTGSPITSYTVSRMGLDGLGSVVSVAGVSPDESGNVPLTAADIRALSISGGNMEGPINMNGQILSGLNAPTANDHAANMGYVNEQVKKAAPRNLLDNSDFRNPVNQRGFKSGTASQETYFIDRWLFNRTSDGGTVEVKDGKVICSSAYLVQRLPLDRLDSTKKYVIVYTRADGTRAVNNTPWIDFDYYNYGYHRVVLYVGTETIVNVALYEGEYTAETLPEYQAPVHEEELRRCQRYFIRVDMSYAPKGFGYAPNTSEIKIKVPTRTSLRINPSVTFSDGNSISDIYLSGAGQHLNPTSMVADTSDDGLSFTFKVSSATSGGIYVMAARSAFPIHFSADL